MDEYIVKKCSYGKGVYFYYKNGKLHREEGPAIVSSYDIGRIKGRKSKDEVLYKEKIIHEAVPPGHTNTAIIEDPSGLCPEINMAVYYLEGQPYSKKDFKEIKTKIDMKNELSKELSLNESNIKKNKI
jgi:hypothetical protein